MMAAMTKPASPAKVILAALEHTYESAEVITQAFAQARQLPGAELHFVHVVDERFPAHPDVVQRTQLVYQARQFLDDALPASSDVPYAKHVAEGNPAKQVLELAADLGAALLVVGSGKPKIERLLLGSVSAKVTEGAHCPVLVVRAVDYPEISPKIEPPCPDCAAVRRTTNGATLWCEEHSRRHVHGHVFSEVPESFGVGSTFLRPNG